MSMYLYAGSLFVVVDSVYPNEASPYVLLWWYMYMYIHVCINCGPTLGQWGFWWACVSQRAKVATSGWKPQALCYEPKLNYYNNNHLFLLSLTLLSSTPLRPTSLCVHSVQMLKLQRLHKSCRGNGTSSCILCGYDFTRHRSRGPISMHICRECSKVCGCAWCVVCLCVHVYVCVCVCVCVHV